MIAYGKVDIGSYCLLPIGGTTYWQYVVLCVYSRWYYI
jgi:hypothetical protein